MNKSVSWKYVLQDKALRLHLAACLGVGVSLIWFLPYFFTEILPARQGWVIDDPVLALFTPRDHSVVIFILIYASVVFFILRSAGKADVMLTGIEAYLLLQIFRTITMITITLEPPPGIIPLTDPIIAVLAYNDQVVTKDLFFSGHCSTLFLLVLLERRRLFKFLIFVVTLIVAVLLLAQRVHYFVDIAAAPAAAVICYGLANRLLQPYFAKET